MRMPNDTGIPKISSEYVPQPSYIDLHPMCRTAEDTNRPKWCKCGDEPDKPVIPPVDPPVDPPVKEGAQISNVGGVTPITITDGGNINLTKIIESTDTPNEFIIRLGVDVKDVDVDISLVPNTSASLVLIVDISTSMNVCAGCGASLNSSHAAGCVYRVGTQTTVVAANTRVALACEAAKSFLRQYLVSNSSMSEQRFASLVFFGTTANMVVNWTDISNASDDSPEFKPFITALTNPTLQSGTFTQGGLIVGRNMWNIDKAPKVDGSPTLNRFTVIMTDGDPNITLNTNATGQAYLTNFNTTTIPSSATGSAQNTNAGFAAARPLVEAIAQQLDKGIENCVTSGVYTIAFQTGASFVVSGVTHPSAADWLKNSIASNPAYAFDADTGIALSLAFEDVMTNIRNVINAWKVTDLMGDDIEFMGTVGDDGNISDSESNTLSWSIIESKPTSETDVAKTYSLSYRIKYLGDSTEPVETNAETFLMYALGEDGDMYSEVVRADFTEIPAISC